MTQQLIVLILFVGASWFLGRTVWRTFKGSDRTPGCAKCLPADQQATSSKR